MCNDYEQHIAFAAYAEAVRALELTTPSGESEADLPQADDIRIGDVGTVLRAAGNGVELVQMKFGFPPPGPRAGPVFNFKSDGRQFKDSRRCLIILSGFFEFTGAKYPKAKHRFTLRGSPIMAVAGLWSEAGDGALSFTMLTTTPGAVSRALPRSPGRGAEARGLGGLVVPQQARGGAAEAASPRFA